MLIIMASDVAWRVPAMQEVRIRAPRRDKLCMTFAPGLGCCGMVHLATKID